MENDTTDEQEKKEAKVENQGTEEVSSEQTEEQDLQATEEASQKPTQVDYKSKYFYLAAEMENLRKRSQREREQTLKFGTERILGDLIEVVDNFDRTAGMLRVDEDEKVKNIVIGLDMVRKQFVDVLEKNGLKEVEAVGKEFDPNFHEAMAQEYVEGAKPSEVVKEFQKGYTLNGRLLRAAKVIVNSDKQ